QRLLAALARMAQAGEPVPRAGNLLLRVRRQDAEGADVVRARRGPPAVRRCRDLVPMARHARDQEEPRGRRAHPVRFPADRCSRARGVGARSATGTSSPSTPSLGIAAQVSFIDGFVPQTISTPDTTIEIDLLSGGAITDPVALAAFTGTGTLPTKLLITDL